MMKQKEIRDMEKRAERLNAILKEQKAEFHVVYYRNWKNNVAHEGYVLKSEDTEITTMDPVIYTDSIIKNWYEKTDTEVVELFLKLYKRMVIMEPFPIKEFKNKEFLLNRILPRLLGSENNKKELLKAGKVFVQLENLDLLMTFAIPLGEPELPKEAEVSVPVSHELLALADVTIEEAKNHALANIEKLAKVESMNEVLNELLGTDDYYDTESETMFICTNTNKCYGAAAILCPSVQEELQRRLGNEVFVLPSSIHEMIVVPSSSSIYGADELQAMVQVINEDQVELDEQLTNSVYMLRNGSLEIVS
ncbi:DUF5688 family protein [Dorea longicatena]|uniref:DUF5688 family protein n=1 Tax=Dorea longicatena TaxID=88431 RepID=UPI00156F6758|nr:DUF5688 family protein [Dorea longicatena]NSD68970.1 hypothetical protein [Dorea longicatena]